jgi:hypothetical protein
MPPCSKRLPAFGILGKEGELNRLPKNVTTNFFASTRGDPLAPKLLQSNTHNRQGTKEKGNDKRF